MQWLLGLERGDLARWSRCLVRAWGDPLPVARRPPLGQLVKSIISGRTRDAVSAAGYDRLLAIFPDLGALAAEPVGRVERLIEGVTFAGDKAGYLVAAMRRIGAERPGHDLGFLAEPPLGEAVAWLERLPGVARKVAAATLNASTLDRPILIVDTHVLRVLARLGFVDGRAGYRAASEAVTAAMPDWTGADFLRFHILLKRLGQRLCRWDVAECGECPLNAVDLGAARCRHGATAAPSGRDFERTPRP